MSAQRAVAASPVTAGDRTVYTARRQASAVNLCSFLRWSRHGCSWSSCPMFAFRFADLRFWSHAVGLAYGENSLAHPEPAHYSDAVSRLSRVEGHRRDDGRSQTPARSGAGHGITRRLTVSTALALVCPGCWSCRVAGTSQCLARGESQPESPKGPGWGLTAGLLSQVLEHERAEAPPGARLFRTVR